MTDTTTFKQDVYNIVAQVPKGCVVTYGDVARLAGWPLHSRLVGRILSEVPNDSNLPCHRVVNSQGRLSPVFHEQRQRLEAEGVVLAENGKVNLKKYRCKFEKLEVHNDIEAAIISMADERQAAVLRRFFKTGAGQYGEGDQFLGVKNPQVRSVVKEVWKETPLEEAVELARSPWHEVRLCGLLIMVAQFERAASKRAPSSSHEWPSGSGLNFVKAAEEKNPDEAKTKEIFETYLSLHPFINNWDLVDLSAYKIAGRYELLHPETRILDEWIRPEYSLWQRRISMVSTWISIRERQFGKALQRAEVLLSSDHDLLHKAAGWMLREIYKHDGRDEVEEFLERHVAQMPSVMLSYTTELMPPQQRRYWQQRRRNSSSTI